MRWSRSTAVAAFATIQCIGCAEEAIDPVPTAAPTTTTPPVGEGGSPSEGPRVREVYLRNPIGGPADNLLADGDFELSIVPEGSSGQYGWVAFRSTGAEQAIFAETGGLCRTGLRCGRVPGNSILFGRGTAAANEVSHRASLWMKAVEPDEESPNPCALADVYVIRCSSFDVVEELAPADAPDESGWCQFSGEVEGSRVGYCMYIDLRSREILIDDATLLAAPDLDQKPPPPPVSPLPPEKHERMQRIRQIIRSRTPIGELPPRPDGEPSRPD